MAQKLSNFKSGYTSPYTVWASEPGTSGDVKNPGAEKIKQGWVIEKPSHKTFNFWMNQTDRRLAELEARVAWLISELGYNDN